jgi:hypothetical protein
VVANCTAEPLKIHLGDSTDIMSEIYPLAEINDLIKIESIP